MRINVLLFSDFETLDAFGPVEILGRLPEYTLHFVSHKGGIIYSAQHVPIATETLNNCQGQYLLVPGGQGTRALCEDAAFLDWLSTLAAQSEKCLTVCTGSALLAKTGLLNGKQATSNKRSFAWVIQQGPAVKWLSCARWVADGKFYTSSGISAGIDMALGFIADQHGQDVALAIAQRIEYLWQQDRTNDPFAVEKIAQ